MRYEMTKIDYINYILSVYPGLKRKEYSLHVMKKDKLEKIYLKVKGEQHDRDDMHSV